MVKLPWVIPGIRRPNFRFYRLTFTLPREVPTKLFVLTLFLAIFYIYMGGVYDVVEKPLTIGSDQKGNPLLFYPGGIDRQFLLEGIVAALLMFVGFIGLYLMDSATHDPHDPNRAYKYMTVGSVLIVLAMIVLQRMIDLKQGKT